MTLELPSMVDRWKFRLDNPLVTSMANFVAKSEFESFVRHASVFVDLCRESSTPRAYAFPVRVDIEKTLYAEKTLLFSRGSGFRPTLLPRLSQAHQSNLHVPFSYNK